MGASLPPVPRRAIVAEAIRIGFPALPLPILSLDLTAPDFMARHAAMGGTYTRAGTRRYIGADKLVKVAAANEWPLEYDLYTGRVLGRAVYGTAANNMAVGSGRDLTQAAWNLKTNVTVALDQVGIDGAANSASSVLATAANAVIGQAITDAVANKRAGAFCLKRLVGTGSIEISVDGGTNWRTVTSEVFADGWNRVHQVNGSAVTNPDIRIRLGTSGDKIAVDFVTITQNDHVGALTLPGETANNDANTMPVYGCPAAGCMALRFHGISTGVGTRYVAALGALGTEVRAGIYLSSNTNAQIWASALDSTAQVDMEAGATAAPAYPTLDRNRAWMPRRACIQWKANGYKSAVHGTLGAGDASATLGDVARLAIGVRHVDYSTALDGWVSRIDIYPELDDAELALVSSLPDAIVAWGDSLAGTTGATTADTSWPYLLRLWAGSQALPTDVLWQRARRLGDATWDQGRAVGPPREVISQSIGGETSGQVKARFDAARHHWQFTAIIIAGQNDASGGDVGAAAVAAAAAFANIAAMVAALGHDRFLVLTVPATVADGAPGSVARTYKLALNTAIRQAWPANIVDIESFLLTFGSDGGGTDETARGLGQCPPSTLFDAVHPNDKGHRLRAMAALSVIERKGWFNGFLGSLGA